MQGEKAREACFRSKMIVASHSLSKPEISRYSRQLLVSDFGVEGQESLRSGSVLVVGAGGLGCPCATYLAAAGVGTVGIVDFDTVSLDNLHRQVAHKERNVGKKKTESLKESLQDLNSSAKVICHSEVLDRHNALQIFESYDVIVDCSDNPATRYLINDACVLLKKPLVSGSALRWEGQMTVYNYGEKCPCYRCIFPVPPTANLVTNCAEGGVLGPVVGVIGSLQALECVKILAGVATTYAGRLLLFDGQSARTSTVVLRSRSPKCAVCGDYPSVAELIDYELFCGSGVHDKVQEQRILAQSERVGVAEYAMLRKSRGLLAEEDLSMPPTRPPPPSPAKAATDEKARVPSPPLETSAKRAGPQLDIPEGQRLLRLIDTRPPNEFAIAHLPEAINVPLENLKTLDMEGLAHLIGFERKEEFEKKRKITEKKRREDVDRELFVICHRGNDSQIAVRLLQEKLSPQVADGLRIRDITGGYQAWADIVDTQFPVY